MKNILKNEPSLDQSILFQINENISNAIYGLEYLKKDIYAASPAKSKEDIITTLNLLLEDLQEMGFLDETSKSLITKAINGVKELKGEICK